jgi:hypothetical protein
MADDSGSSAVLGMIVGALIVGAVLFVVFVGFPGGSGPGDVDVTIEAPAPSLPAPAPSG